MYYVAQNNEKTGPFTLEQLREMWRAGTVSPQTLFWEPGLTDWQPLERIAASLLAAPPAFPVASPDPLSPVSTAHEPSAYDLPASHLPAATISPAPVPTPAPSASLSTVVTLPAPAPADTPGSLIAPTRLPAGSAYPATGAAFPPPGMGTAGPPQVPPAAYVSLGFALFGPVIVIFIPVAGWLVGGGMMAAAVVCGHSARAGIQQSGNRLPGKGIATVGLILGYLGILFEVLFVLGIIFIFGYAIIHGSTPGQHVPR